MKLQFDSISELGEPGSEFLKLFNLYWPAYKEWLNSNETTPLTNLKTSKAALKKYMPEMMPIYEHSCKLVNAGDLAARFLTGFQPPAHISGCSQAVLVGEDVQLVRNYDYHPDLIEGALLLSSWNGKKVIATSDCLLGALDGMNEDGLAISITFGGRKVVGEGFGIPFIVRYVLEFCSTVESAVKALVRIPSHMSYNVTVVDKTGAFKTVFLSPDKAPVVNDDAYTTNHQESIDWHANAAFNKTLERASFLKELLAKEGLNAKTLVKTFLQKPLYNTMFSEGFGTLYTAVYKPKEGVVQFLWPHGSITQSFDKFIEQSNLIEYDIINTEVMEGDVSEKTIAKMAPKKIVSFETSKDKKNKPKKTKGIKKNIPSRGSFESLGKLLYK